MKTLRKLSNRKLDELQDRVSSEYWQTLDMSPKTVNEKALRRIKAKLLKIGNERMRRLGL